MEEKRLVLGLIAHVDAGKTTLAESILYRCGNIRSLGRVDLGSTFLDTHALERQRGITIFSKEAQVTFPGGRQVTLMDTPGHVDFSAETERCFQALDAAVLVINGAEGVQAQALTLWKLLHRYRVPVILFVNKMDLPGIRRSERLGELRRRLSDKIVAFPLNNEEQLENAAVCRESLMEEYLETGQLSDEALQEAVAMRELCPCFFGSARTLAGVTELLEGVERLVPRRQYPEEFGASVIKIVRQSDGTRLTYLKLTGGVLRVRDEIDGEKINQIRLYSGTSYEQLQEAGAGMVVAVTGLNESYVGQGLGAQKETAKPSLVPVITSRLLYPKTVAAPVMYQIMCRLGEEMPEISVSQSPETGDILVQLMGEVQVEILKSILQERFDIPVEFGGRTILYRETIAEAATGIGHFEPLRHYAEVHLRVEPGEPNSGIVVQSLCSEDMLARNWQRLIMTHLKERTHPGTAIGCEVTDLVISLIAGRAHPKHTEGGDFRQATYRALRNALRIAGCRVLEPVYRYRIEVPQGVIGRTMTDIQQMNGTMSEPESADDMAVLTGRVPVAAFGEYATTLREYSRGLGRLSVTPDGYMPCHNEEEVVSQYGYDPDLDEHNPCGSVFCAQGSGFLVPWDEVAAYAHVENSWSKGEQAAGSMGMATGGRQSGSMERTITTEEIEEIFLRTYGNRGTSRPKPKEKTVREYGTEEKQPYVPKKKRPEGRYLLVDGYNCVFAFSELKALAAENLEAARGRLMDLLDEYAGVLGYPVILVFDAYKVEGGQESVTRYHRLHVVYTKEAETADQYIEKTVHKLAADHEVTVATSDGLEQLIIWGQGAIRMSARELEATMREARGQAMEQYGQRMKTERNKPFEALLKPYQEQ